MNFSKTFYNNKNFENKIQLELSKAKFNNLTNDNKLLKNRIYKSNYKSLSIINSKKTLSQNITTNTIINY